MLSHILFMVVVYGQEVIMLPHQLYMMEVVGKEMIMLSSETEYDESGRLGGENIVTQNCILC